MTASGCEAERRRLAVAIATKRREFDRAALASLTDPAATKQATVLRGELAALESEREDVLAALRAALEIADERKVEDRSDQWRAAAGGADRALAELEASAADIESLITDLGDRLAAFYTTHRTWKEPLARLSDNQARGFLSGLTVLDYREVLGELERFIKIRITGQQAPPLTLAQRARARADAARKTIGLRVLPTNIAGEISV